jgi:cation transport regulator ChaC
MYVFGYGSLVSAASVEGTLGYGIDESRLSVATLAGWQRSWNVGSDKSSHPERTFHLDDGSIFDGVTVVLGLEKAPQQSCFGRVFPVRRRDLRPLDTRERNYLRLDVTSQVTWAGKPDRCVVYTYVSSDAAMARIATAQELGAPVNIRQGYVDLVESAFSAIGKLDEYRRAVPRLPFPVQSMSVVTR